VVFVYLELNCLSHYLSVYVATATHSLASDSFSTRMGWDGE